MPATEKSLFLCTHYTADGKETERLVSAESAHDARKHMGHVCKASAADLARVMQAGGKIEEVAE